MTVYNLICGFCGAPFAVEGKPKQKYCSISCGSKARRRIADPNLYENGWDSINAYIAGLILSDGCLTKRHNTEVVVISGNDRELMNRIHAVFCPERKLYESKPYKGKVTYRLQNENQEVIRFLKEKALLHERKSLSLQFPDIPKEYVSHFFRGFYDGDGSICVVQGKNRPYFLCNITCASLSFIKSLRNILINQDISVSQPREDKRYSAYQISWSETGSVQKFFHWLYKDKNLYMKRKYNAFVDNNIMLWQANKQVRQGNDIVSSA